VVEIDPFGRDVAVDQVRVRLLAGGGVARGGGGTDDGDGVTVGVEEFHLG